MLGIKVTNLLRILRLPPSDVVSCGAWVGSGTWSIRGFVSDVWLLTVRFSLTSEEPQLSESQASKVLSSLLQSGDRFGEAHAPAWPPHGIDLCLATWVERLLRRSILEADRLLPMHSGHLLQC
jgi:hypothetical protein